MIALLAATLARAEAPVHLIAGASATVGPPSLGAGTLGRIAFTPFKTVGFEAGAREMVATRDTRLLGSVFFGLRGITTPASWIRAGFAHHHETPWDVVKDDPVGAIAGIAPDIIHRSGAEVGFGVAPPRGRRHPLTRRGTLGGCHAGFGRTQRLRIPGFDRGHSPGQAPGRGGSAAGAVTALPVARLLVRRRATSCTSRELRSPSLVCS